MSEITARRDYYAQSAVASGELVKCFLPSVVGGWFKLSLEEALTTIYNQARIAGHYGNLALEWSMFEERDTLILPHAIKTVVTDPAVLLLQLRESDKSLRFIQGRLKRAREQRDEARAEAERLKKEIALLLLKCGV